MSLFDNVNQSSNVEADTDHVKGQRRSPLDSGIYNLIIKYAYGEKKKSGSTFINLVFETPEKREVKISECVASGDAKGNKTYYERKQDDGSMKQFNLPGFALINDLATLVAGKSITACTSEKKTIMLYNFDTKCDKPTEVDMLTELVGQPVCGCVLNTIEDKTAKNDAYDSAKPNSKTNQLYLPTGDTRSKNTIDKFLAASDRKTAQETAAGVESAFAESWLTQWKSKINDESTEVKSAGLKGAPAATGENATKAPLFA